MPKRTDIESILIIGSGPIIIGQACEFDYSGTQACKALREDGYRVILVTSTPATIMTDPGVSDRTYVEPLTAEVIEKILEKERPDAILPTLGGQTGLNLGTELWEAGILQKYNVEMLGATYEVIRSAEDREEFKQAVNDVGLDLPRSIVVESFDAARGAIRDLGLPIVIRPSYTLGGTGGGLARTQEEFERIVKDGLHWSPVNQVLLEESVEGWKEFELEVMRDRADNAVIVCSIENFDAMGVHTGDSITVAPAQTLTDKEYQLMRNAAIAIIRRIGVETGGSNIQFALDPSSGRMVVIEMNPRVSRSSALASKATGFPIAKIAAKLALGYTLDEIPNDITEKTPACYEPTIDYCVVKIPRFDFAKFPDTDPELTTKMKSVGEVMAIGRTFKEAAQKALQSLEIKAFGFGLDDLQDGVNGDARYSLEEIRDKLQVPNSERIFYIRHAFRAGMSFEDVQRLTQVDPWFLDNLLELVEFEGELEKVNDLKSVTPELLLEAKRLGYSDSQLARAFHSQPALVRERRIKEGIESTFKLVDTCAAEFEAATPYFYSTYESEDEFRSTVDTKKVMILGGGPNRIGQGIEFDYCCVHASLSLKEEGWETIMVNSNPETVSTDYDISDKLYFEPLTLENVLNIYDKEKPDGVILQLGGQTPLNLAHGLAEAGVPIFGTSPDSIDLAEDRKRFKVFLDELDLLQPKNATVMTQEEAREAAARIGYPVLVRPSYVLGGRAMEIVWDESELEHYVDFAIQVNPGKPVLIDQYLEEAIEVDVDSISDGDIVVIGGILEHIEEAGVHSGDSSCALPPYSLNESDLQEIRRITKVIGEGLNVKGLMNIQFAVKGGKVYILEVNPRGSRTIPFVSKAINVPLAKLAAKVMIGQKLKDLGFEKSVRVSHIAVKKSVFPFNRFTNVDIILGPEMKSTGEVMGIDDDFGMAFAKSHMAATQSLPMSGKVFISVNSRDKKYVPAIVRDLLDLGFQVVATPGTRRYLVSTGIEAVEEVKKIADGSPNVLDLMDREEIKLLINTPSGRGTKLDEAQIRMHTIVLGVPCITTIAAARAAVSGLRALKSRDFTVRALQDYFPTRT